MQKFPPFFSLKFVSSSQNMPEDMLISGFLLHKAELQTCEITNLLSRRLKTSNTHPLYLFYRSDFKRL